MVLHGNGEQTRDFVYVDDVVEAMVAAATAPSIDRLTINVGSGVETSLKTLAQQVLEVSNSTSEWILREDQDPGPSRMAADIRLARSKLGYKPHIALQEGLRRMLTRDPRFQPAALAEPA